MMRICATASLLALALAMNVEARVEVERLPDNPLLSVAANPELEGNINGPSVIRVPDWIVRPLGRYYLYFAHHQGRFIRLAYADRPGGPFTVYRPGALALADSLFPEVAPSPEELPAERRFGMEAGRARAPYAHIASPDVLVVDDARQIRMYYHGQHHDGRQLTRVAVSRDGIHFEAQRQLLGRPYFRVFRYRGAWYALSMPGVVYRSPDGLHDFIEGPALFDPTMRHSAVLVQDDRLHVFFTRSGDAPESILHSTVELRGDWLEWQATAAELVLAPERRWEGGHLPLEPSARGAVLQPVRQLRDPAIFADRHGVFLYYAIAGESGIGIARIRGGL